MLDVAIPKPGAFRKWVIEVKEILEVSSYVWSVQAGVSQNALSKFINGNQQDLRLETASLLVDYARKAAKEKDVLLPALPLEICKAPSREPLEGAT